MTNDPTYKQAAGVAAYKVTHMRNAEGQVAPHYLHPLFTPTQEAFEAAYAIPHFAEIIDQEVAGEQAADGPLIALAQAAPTPEVQAQFTRWLAFINADLDPWTTGGAIHFRPHWARVLMHALVLATSEELPESQLQALCHAAVFHDSRRADPYLDTGHGARAAEYYRSFCEETVAGTTRNTQAAQTIAFNVRAYLAMAWHDRDDDAGLAAIDRSFSEGTALTPTPGDENPATQGVPTTIPCNGDAEEAKHLYLLFKDADALDRVRLGPSELDPRFFRTPFAIPQLDFAHQLLHLSR